MPLDRFLIAPINTGFQTSLKPWLIPDDAFAELRNAYVFRGRVRKRFGSMLMGLTPLLSRLRIQVATTDGAGAASGTVPGSIFKVGQMFSIGSNVYTVQATGTPVVMLSTGGATTHTFNTTTGAFSFTGAALATAVFWYPAEPVMGFTLYELGSINNQPLYAFDTQFAYKFFPNAGWARSGTGFNPIWHGNNLNFFWPCNWEGITPNLVALFVSNFQVTNINGAGTFNDDPIWVTTDGSAWSIFRPFFQPNSGLQDTGPYVATSRLIIAFKNRLLLLNTIENSNTSVSQGTTNGAGNLSGNIGVASALGQWFDINDQIFTVTSNAAGVQPLSFSGSGTATFNFSTGDFAFAGVSPTANVSFFAAAGTNTNYVNRCRFSHNGSPFARNAWYEQNQKDTSGLVVNNNNIADGGGFIDATTEEAIISAEFIKDRLIVYFERSTWEIAYTGNEVLPFVWNKINTELGSESEMSTVPFDKVVLTIGNTGVHACNGSNVERIDIKIPDEVFDIKSKNQNVQRVFGIRDYFPEMVYWTFSSEDNSQTYPNRVLVYNYQNDSWAINDDCITAFGYFEQQSDMTWNSTTLTWEQCNFTWVSGVIQAQSRQVVAGNQQGFTFLIVADLSRNTAAMQISNMVLNSPSSGFITLTVVDHTLAIGDYIAIENTNGVFGFSLPLHTIYQVVQMITANTFVIFAPTVVGTYTGGGTIARVSNIEILSKQWNPYVDKGQNVYIAKIDFGVETTEDGQVTVDYFTSSTEDSINDDGGASGTNTMVGNGILETSPYPIALAPLEQEQRRLWHPIYFQSEGECIQILISLSPDQITNTSIAWEDFVLEGMVLHSMPISTRLQ